MEQKVKWSTVSAGVHHSLALDKEKRLWVWGDNFNLELGVSETIADQWEPMLVYPTRKWTSISAGNLYSLLIDEKDRVWVCGRNNVSGRLGIKDRLNLIDHPITIEAGSHKWKHHALAVAGYYHSAVLSEHGLVWMWGCNNYGQLGEMGKDSYTPLLNSFNNWKSISIGGFHTIALDEENMLWGWGDNFYGEIGFESGSEECCPLPTKVVCPYKKWKAISAGKYHSLLIDMDGFLWTCGADIHTSDVPSKLQKVMEDKRWKKIAAGECSSLAIDENGDLWAWGDNQYGRLGFTPASDKKRDVLVITPKQVILPDEPNKKWKEISIKKHHVLAIDENDDIYSWGRNDSGRLGLGLGIEEDFIAPRRLNVTI